MVDAETSLIAVLNAMGARQSNPVFEVIANSSLIELEKKYPEDKGYVGNSSWRAFYHCHNSPDKPEHEHGHFHIFINAENDNDSSHWPHLASLSMDSMGQPFQWFTVNQWVTSGHWLSAPQLIKGMTNGIVDESMSLVEQWLVYMMHCYRDEISQLLQDRDAGLNALVKQGNREDVLKDRGVYTLSVQPINLQSKLAAVFSGKQLRECQLIE